MKYAVRLCSFVRKRLLYYDTHNHDVRLATEILLYRYTD